MILNRYCEASDNDSNLRCIAIQKMLAKDCESIQYTEYFCRPKPADNDRRSSMAAIANEDDDADVEESRDPIPLPLPASGSGKKRQGQGLLTRASGWVPQLKKPKGTRKQSTQD